MGVRPLAGLTYRSLCAEPTENSRGTTCVYISKAALTCTKEGIPEKLVYVKRKIDLYNMLTGVRRGGQSGRSNERTLMMTKAAQRAGLPHGTLSGHRARPLSGALALALINTETLDRGKKRDALSSPEALARWWEETCERYHDECVIAETDAPIIWTDELLGAVKALRVALRACATHVIEQQGVEEEDLAPVNKILSLGYSALERTERGGVKAVVRLHDPERGSILLPIARSAVLLFTTLDWRRLHQCRHDRCIVFFYDTSKSGTRRWCSPDCMNRARSIQHYRMTKTAAAPKS
jgi:predicted RNA-binding Zn ribbon-like protein